MATELPFAEVERVSRFLALQRQQVQSGKFDAMPPKARRAFVLASLTACEAALGITREHMAVLDRVVRQATAAADAAEAVERAEQSVPPL